MIASVASTAFFTPPDTGASTRSMPRAARFSPSALVPTGSEELMSSTSMPFGSSAPSTHSRTALPSGSMVRNTSAPRAASAAEAQLPAPFRS